MASQSDLSVKARPAKTGEGLHFVPLPPRAELRSCTVSTTIGEVVLIGSRGVIVNVELPVNGAAVHDDSRPPDDPETLNVAATQLREYFDGTRQEFGLEVSPRGTPFQMSVWKRLTQIPYGTTTTYGQIAAEVGNPRASRAVGRANNKNPIALIIPCHRVIGASGALVGYGGGLEAKELLLELERKVVAGAN